MAEQKVTLDQIATTLSNIQETLKNFPTRDEMKEAINNATKQSERNLRTYIGEGVDSILNTLELYVTKEEARKIVVEFNKLKAEVVKLSSN